MKPSDCVHGLVTCATFPGPEGRVDLLLTYIKAGNRANILNYADGPRRDTSRMNTPNTIGYALHGNLYLNITNRCTLRCTFCPKFNGVWEVQGYNLRTHHEPSVAEMLAAVGDPREYREVVFCGLGEPMLRLYPLLEAATRLRGQGAHVRVNTDGLANLVYGRDVTPDLEDNIDALSISLNAQDEETYNLHCRPTLPGAYPAVLDFARRARDFVPVVTLTAIDGLPGVDIAACEHIADELGVHFRRRMLDEVG